LALSITVGKVLGEIGTGTSGLYESCLPSPQFVVRPPDAEGWFALRHQLGACVVAFGIAVDDLGFPALPHTWPHDFTIAPTIAPAAIASIQLPKNHVHASVKGMGM